MKVFAISLFEPPVSFNGNWNISEILSSQGVASIQIEALEKRIVTVFTDVLGLRILDGCDLLEYWPICSAPNGWLFQILDGGWLSQEKQCSRQRRHLFGSDVKEYFVSSLSCCVSVLTKRVPSVQFSPL